MITIDAREPYVWPHRSSKEVIMRKEVTVMMEHQSIVVVEEAMVMPEKVMVMKNEG